MGFSLIEVLVALFLFATVALQAAQLQAVAIGHTKDAWQLTIATQYGSNLLNIVCGLNKSINSQAVVKRWQQQIQQQLVAGEGGLVGSGKQAEVTIHWLDSQGKQQYVTMQCPNPVKA